MSLDAVVTSEESSSFNSNSRIICRVCEKQFSQYTCPRCNTRYCSLPCYKSHSLRCTESFMRENVMEGLRQLQPGEESKSKMLDILKRFHEEDETESFDEEDIQFIMSLSTMSSILKQNKLNGENYSVWIRMLNSTLIEEGCRFVYNHVCPAAPTKYDSRKHWDDYNKWKDANERGCAVILSSMDLKYLSEISKTSDVFDMVSCLRSCFQEENRVLLHKVVGELISTKQAQETPVKDHILKMMSLISEYEILGGFVGDRFMVDLILHSLTPAFAPLVLDITSLKKDVGLSSLGEEVLKFDAGLSKKSQHVDIPSRDMVVLSTPVKREREYVRSVMTRSKTLKIMAEKAQSGSICKKCNHPGHWKIDCPLNKKGFPGSKALE